MSTTQESSALQVIRDLKKQLISLFPEYPEIIRMLPEQIFFKSQQIEKDDPMLAECKGTFIYNMKLFILKVRHIPSNHVIGVFFEKGRIRFRISSGTNPENFRALSQSKDKLHFLEEIIADESEDFELVCE